MIKQFNEWINEALNVKDYPVMINLHKDLVTLLNKNKKIEIVQDYGPEPNKYSSKEIVSNFTLKGYEDDGYRDGYRFTVTYKTGLNLFSLFMPNVGYAHNLDGDITAKEILKIIKNRVKNETSLFK